MNGWVGRFWMDGWGDGGRDGGRDGWSEGGIMDERLNGWMDG